MYPFNLIRTSDVIKRSNDDFKKSVDFPHNIPLTKKKIPQKIKAT